MARYKSRARHNMLNSGYSQAGASQRKAALKGFKASSGPATNDIDYNNYTMRQRARLLYMAQPLATSAIKTNRTNVVGEGLKLKAKIDREILKLTPEQATAWEKQVEKEFSLWADNKNACDATGVNDFYEMQQLALMSWLLSGDVFALFKTQSPTVLNPYSLTVHLIEADRISTPFYKNYLSWLITDGINPDNNNKIHDGVEVNAAGKIVAYYICNRYPFQSEPDMPTWQRIEATGKETGMPNILQIMDSERPDQYRGVSYLAQVIEPLLQLRRYTESELMAALIESYFTAWIKTTANTDTMPFNEAAPGDEFNEDAGPNVPNPDDFKMGPGTTHVLQPGEDVVFGDAKRPASGFSAFLRTVAEEIGAALEIPADILLKSFNASYSASRGALLEAWKGFRMRRRWFANDFCQPVYEAWLAEAVSIGRINAPGFFTNPLIRKAYSGCEWTGPSQGQLNPVQEIQAEIYACEHGFSTHSQSTIRLNGGDWSKNIETLKGENAQLQDATAQEVKS